MLRSLRLVYKYETLVCFLRNSSRPVNSMPLSQTIHFNVQDIQYSNFHSCSVLLKKGGGGDSKKPSKKGKNKNKANLDDFLDELSDDEDDVKNDMTTTELENSNPNSPVVKFLKEHTKSGN